MLFLIKILGMCLITLSTTLVGISKSQELKSRVKALDWYITAIFFIGDRIRFSGDEIEKVLKRIPDHLDFFEVYTPFRVELKVSGLNKEDEQAVLDFFGSIGTGDTKRQLDLCELYGKELSKRYDAALEIMEKNTRMFKGLGFFIGLGISIILV